MYCDTVMHCCCMENGVGFHAALYIGHTWWGAWHCWVLHDDCGCGVLVCAWGMYGFGHGGGLGWVLWGFTLC